MDNNITNMQHKILGILIQNPATINNISKKLKISKDEVYAEIIILIHNGYIYNDVDIFSSNINSDNIDLDASFVPTEKGIQEYNLKKEKDYNTNFANKISISIIVLTIIGIIATIISSLLSR